MRVSGFNYIEMKPIGLADMVFHRISQVKQDFTTELNKDIPSFAMKCLD